MSAVTMTRIIRYFCARRPRCCYMPRVRGADLSLCAFAFELHVFVVSRGGFMRCSENCEYFDIFRNARDAARLYNLLSCITIIYIKKIGGAMQPFYKRKVC